MWKPASAGRDQPACGRFARQQARREVKILALGPMAGVDAAIKLLPMNTSSRANKVFLVADRRSAGSAPSSPTLRRFRLARVLPPERAAALTARKTG